mgnify:CR=1 FL=1
MEIKYINTFEDIEFLIKYIQYKMGFSKYKYIVCSISVISGIYYSIKLQNLIYFFTNTVIMTFIVFFWLKKTENKDINRISKKIAIKNCNKDRYFLSEKKLILDNRKIYIYCNNDKYEMKIDKFIKESYNTNIKFDGIFCATDRYAEYVVEILEEMRIKIPQDVQIIGFDGAKSYPNEHLKISTIKQDIEKLAIEAVNTLQSVVNKSDTIINKVLPVNFLEVETTKKINL